VTRPIHHATAARVGRYNRQLAAYGVELPTILPIQEPTMLDLDKLRAATAILREAIGDESATISVGLHPWSQGAIAAVLAEGGRLEVCDTPSSTFDYAVLECDPHCEVTVYGPHVPRLVERRCECPERDDGLCLACRAEEGAAPCAS
jgi:hypothetical protein